MLLAGGKRRREARPLPELDEGAGPGGGMGAAAAAAGWTSVKLCETSAAWPFAEDVLPKSLDRRLDASLVIARRSALGVGGLRLGCPIAPIKGWSIGFCTRPIRESESIFQPELAVGGPKMPSGVG